jgi:hypothetical protein
MNNKITKGQLSFNNGFSLKNEVIKEINKTNYKILPKLIFHIESPYQKRRFKSEYIEQEVWVKFKGSRSILITQNGWNNLEYKNTIISDLIHMIKLIN